MRGARARIALLAVAMIVGGAGLLLRGEAGEDAGPPPTTTAATAPTSSTAPLPTLPPTTVDPLAPTTAPPMDVAGIEPSGRFVVAAGGTGIVGPGFLHTYTVEVEAGIPLDPAQVAAEVDAILADVRGWTRDGLTAFQRIADPAAAGFRIVLATPPSTDELCAPLRTGGRFSCFEHGVVVINLARWAYGAREASGLELPEYHQMAVSHEVGHALGHPHVGCPAAGAPAPVMMQQTSSIGPCLPNPWPYP